MSHAANPARGDLNPRDEYGRRLEFRRALVAREARLERWIAESRLVVFIAGGICAWLAFVSRICPPVLIALPVVLFIVLAVLHDRVIRARQRAERAAVFYEHGLARLDDAWSGNGDPGADLIDSRHPYTDDLDIFGPGSLFELLCRARTRDGRTTLAAWLRAPANVETARARQAAVAELRTSLDLREDLAVVGGGMATLDPAALRAWTARREASFSAAVLVMAIALPIAAIAALGAWVFFGTGALPFIGVAVLQAFVAWRLRGPIRRIVGGMERPAKDLNLLAGILARFESQSFTSPHLRGLHSQITAAGRPPSRRIAELARLNDRLEWARNAVFAPVAFFLLWEAHHAIAIHRWRLRFGGVVAGWCAAVGEMEALSSLACHAFEHPDDPFPDITTDGPRFEADGLGHPLIPDRRCVRNDVRLGGDLRLLVVSGSNMSGKSTLLRSVGVNAVLAFAGAPVRARRLAISPLVSGASIRRNDSLQEGVSRFYAEITRLHQLLEMTESPPPLLFLIDELLNGTNSHDRRIGAEGVLRSLIHRGAIGLITTHDLALTQIAELLAPRAANVHFEDFIDEGRIAFDYRLRPGVVEKSNALELMRAVGLDVGAREPA